MDNRLPHASSSAHTPCLFLAFHATLVPSFGSQAEAMYADVSSETQRQCQLVLLKQIYIQRAILIRCMLRACRPLAARVGLAMLIEHFAWIGTFASNLPLQNSSVPQKGRHRTHHIVGAVVMWQL